MCKSLELLSEILPNVLENVSDYLFLLMHFTIDSCD